MHLTAWLVFKGSDLATLHYVDVIKQKWNIFKVKGNCLKSDLTYCEIQENEKWRVSFAQEIVNVKQCVLKNDQDEDSYPSDEQLQDILEHISTS